MAHKKLAVDSIGQVAIYKRKGTKTIRLRVAADGSVRMTIPYWVPYAYAADFAKKKSAWVRAQQPLIAVLADQEMIGRLHTIQFSYVSSTTKPRVRVASGVIRLQLPFGVDYRSEDIQNMLHKAAIRALKKEAQDYLPDRVKELAEEHGFSYGKVAIKNMKSRWGSCSSQKNISLNLYLMQLDQTLIDYVILHELVHTKILAHGKVFWDELAQYVANLSELRTVMKQQEPTLCLRTSREN